MIKKLLVLPDVHLTDQVPKVYSVVKKFVKDFQPHETILLGDFMDVSALSAWDFDKRQNMEGRRFKKEISCADREIKFLEKHSKKITYICGNHEYRVDRYLEKNPEMQGLIEIPILLSLKNRSINWVTVDEIYSKGHLNFIHGWYVTKYHAAKHLDVIGDCVVYGHTHLPQNYSKNLALHKEIMAYGLGCLCDKAPEYMHGRFANWINNFAVVYYDTVVGNFNLYEINIIDKSFMWNGKKYKV